MTRHQGAGRVERLQAQGLGSGAMFDSIAERYDLLNRILSMGLDPRWRRRTVQALALDDQGCRVLDLATGTGDLALTVAEHHPRAQIVGVDPSKGMLAIGRSKVTRAGLCERVELTTGDAQSLTFEDDSFDACCMAFGIRNVPDRLSALHEMTRVVRPGGRVAVLELAEPGGGLLGSGARVYIRHVVPRIGGWLSGSREYRYLQESVAGFPPPHAFAAMMAAAGLRRIEVKPLTFGVVTLYVGTVGPADASGSAS